MKVTKPCHDVKGLQNIIQDYDYLLCGSDQIWNPMDYNPLVLLGVNTSKPQIAYAVGTIAESESDKYIHIFQRMKKFLDQFQAISVRERSGKRIFEKYTSTTIDKVLDPTLLLDKRQWNKVRGVGVKHQPYLLCYFLGVTDKYKEYIKLIQTKHQLQQVIMITNTTERVGPSQWISLIAGAGAVLTDSFHGAVFSVIYEKEIYVVERCAPKSVWNPRKGSYPYGNMDRIVDLFESLKIEDRKLETKDDVNRCNRIDYSKVRLRLDQQRKQSIRWIKKQLT